MSIWTKTSSGWVEIGGGGGSDGLEGLGGWAEITEVTGSPKRYAYNDGIDWVAFEWTDTTDPSPNSLTTQAGGLVDALIVGGGTAVLTAGGQQTSGGGARVLDGLRKLDGTAHTVTVGAGGTASTSTDPTLGGVSVLDSHVSGIAGFYTGAGGDSPATALEGASSSITGGSPRVYARGLQGSPRANSGDGASGSATAADGVVIVRVPAAQAAGVDPGSWVTRIDYYAEVTDGIVTDLYQERFYGDDTVRTENGRYASPEQPDDLIPCDPSVAEGWTYADGEFTPPPPDPSWREEAIAALKEQLKDLQKDT